MLFAIVIGTFGGAFLAFVLGRRVLRALTARYGGSPGRDAMIRYAGIVFGAIALAPAIFLSVMGGGSFGMRTAEAAAAALGMGAAASAVLLAVMVVAATTVVVLANTLFGAGLGILLARSLHPRAP